jgi:phosphatidylcholine synthase
VHPFRVVRLRGLTLSLIGLWAVLAIVAGQRFRRSAPVTIGLCAIAVYVVASDAAIRIVVLSTHDRIVDPARKPGRRC